jgi:hypothetical protein
MVGARAQDAVMSDKRFTIRYDSDGNAVALQNGGVDMVDGWPWKGDGTRGNSKSVALLDVPTRQLKAWLRKARESGGVFVHGGWKRDFTVAQLTAELRTREPIARKGKP